MKPTLFRPHVFWLFGLSGAGKSTLAQLLVQELRDRSIPVLQLDGDDLRSGLCRGLGFTDEDRAENLRRSAEVAKTGVASQLCVVAAFITPFAFHRELIQQVVGSGNISFIWIDASLEVCRTRDVKGLYARAGAGGVPQMTGLTSRFEPPQDGAFVIRSDVESPRASASRLMAFASERLADR